MSVRNPQVVDFILKANRWQAEFEKLSTIVLSTGLEEDFKWGVPCYTIQGNNVVLIHGFKDYCALLFVKGALLEDRNGILIRQTENVLAGRQIRFTNSQDIDGMERVIQDYLLEAIKIEMAGLKVEFKRDKDTVYPAEFQSKLNELPNLKAAFESLTPGRRRAYVLYFSQPIQSKTRESRIIKNIQKILDGKGISE